jgi:hypothetical protein
MTPHASPFSEAFLSAWPRPNFTVWASFRLGWKTKCIVNNTGTTWMKAMTLTAALAALSVFAQSAHAREHYHRYSAASVPRYFDSAPAAANSWGGSWTGASETYSNKNAASTGYGGRPRAWCGWEMRQLVGSDPGPQFNLARNWAHWGHAGPPGIGAVVVWAHHVGKIVGQENGAWIIQSGNDGSGVRTRPLPIGNAIAIRWG